jgi:hypothetical protein
MRDSAKNETVVVIGDHDDWQHISAGPNGRPVMAAILDFGIEAAAEFCVAGFSPTGRC